MKRFFLRKWREDRPEEAQQFELPPGKTSIGRERDNRIVIDDENLHGCTSSAEGADAG